MTDAAHQREQVSLAQLGTVTQARQIRLRNERAVLAERERALAEAMASQQLDEGLLADQQQLWTDRWQGWTRSGGALRDGVSLRDDRDLLREMAQLIARRREALQLQSQKLSQDVDAWTQRWRGVQALDESLAARERGLRVAIERATERQRDEDTLMGLASQPGLSAAALATLR